MITGRARAIDGLSTARWRIFPAAQVLFGCLSSSGPSAAGQPGQLQLETSGSSTPFSRV